MRRSHFRFAFTAPPWRQSPAPNAGNFLHIGPDRGGAVHTRAKDLSRIHSLCRAFTVLPVPIHSTRPPDFTVFRPRFTPSITLPPRGRPSTCPGTTHPRFVLASLFVFDGRRRVCASASSTQSKKSSHPFTNAPIASKMSQNVSFHICLRFFGTTYTISVSVVCNFPSHFTAGIDKCLVAKH